MLFLREQTIFLLEVSRFCIALTPNLNIKFEDIARPLEQKLNYNFLWDREPH